MELDRVFLNYLFTCVFMVLLIGCGQNPNESENMPALHSEVKKVFLNTEEGYTINKFTKDSVNVLVDTNGVPIKTGQLLKAECELISFDTNLRVIEMTVEPQVIESQSNTFDLGELKRSKINKYSLEVWKYGDGDQDYLLKNDLGKIIPTDTKIAFIGIEEKAILAPLIEIDKIEPYGYPDFGKTMEVEKDYNLYSSNIVEDEFGNLWTGGENLARNDGVYIQSYLCPSRLDHGIENLMIDAKGNVWFSRITWANDNFFLGKFDGQKFTHYTSNNGLFFSQINKIYEDKDSIIWVGMTNGVLLKIEGDECTYITPKEGMLLADINDIVESEQDEIWLATSAGALLFENEEWKYAKFGSELRSSKINKIHKDYRGNLWLCKDDGISILTKGSIITLDSSNGLLGSSTYEIASNQFGDVMVATANGMSILNLEKNNISHIKYLGQFLKRGYYPIESIMTDVKGNFWSNSWGYLESISCRVSYERDASLGKPLLIGSRGEVIVALPESDLENALAFEDNFKPGFAIVDSGEVNYHSLKEISDEEYIYNIVGSKDEYWISSYTPFLNYDTDKILRLRGGECRDYSLLCDYFGNRIIRVVFVDSKGVIWFGGDSNLIKFENEEFNQIIFNGLSNQMSISSIFEDSRGDMWLGTLESGMIKYNHESFIAFSEKEGLSGNYNTAATEDKNGDIWIATNNGVDKFNDTLFQNYSIAQGLIHDGDIEIQKDANGNIWALTNSPELEERVMNLIVVDSDSNRKDLIYSFVDSDFESDYLSHLIENQFDPWSKNIYTGFESLVTINIDDYDSISRSIPEIQLNTVLINDQFYDFRNMNQHDSLGFSFMSVAPFYNYPQELVLDYNQNHLTFNYTATEWNAPNKISYAYKLYGLDNHWNKITKETTIDYRGLSPGKYTFKVCAIGESKQWSEPFIYSFRIRPPWWLTGVAKGVYVLGGIFLLILFTRWRMRNFRKRQIQLEQEVAAATQVIIEQKEEVEKQHEEVVQAYEKLEFQKKVVEAKNREITDSITYAKRLQNAILPPAKLVKEWLNDSFIFYKPKAIVAGDFYWMEVAKRNGRNIVFYAAADCTGHGVPGAMVSVVCSNALNRAVKEFKINDPAVLLDVVSRLVQESFAQSDEIIRDGMDIAICAVDLVEKKIWFAGANNPLYRITDIDVEVPDDVDVVESGKRKLVEYKPDKQAVGDGAFDLPYHTTEIQLVPGDCLYIFSDGFADQFGGDKGKKYKSANFKSFLLQIEGQEMEAQRLILDTEIERWKGEYEQVDDICVIGLRVNGHMGKIFTKRELEVIQKISEGKPSKIIAEELKIAKNTVDTHRKRIMAKTNAHNSTELINFCKKHEII